MKVNTKDFYSLSDIVGIIKSFLHFLGKKWWVLVIAALAGGVLGVLYHSSQNSKYEAVCTFILEEKQGGITGLGSIASQFGLDMGAGSGAGGIFAGDNILDILKSKKVVQQVLLSHVSDSLTIRHSLCDLYLDFSGIKRKWRNKKLLADINFKQTKDSISPIQDSVLNIVYNAIIKNNLTANRISKKGTIIKVQVTAANNLFARKMTERLVEEAAKLYLNIKTGTAQTNINSMQRRSDSLLTLLNVRSYSAAAAQVLDVNPGIKTAAVPVEISVRDKSVIAALYTEVTKNLEASKLMLSQQTPIIQLLDKPAILLPDNKKSIFFIVVVFSFVLIILTIFLLSIMYLRKRINTNTSKD